MIAVPFYAQLIRTTLRGSPFPDIERSVSIILGTAAQESGFQYTEQIGGGPALGLLQVEPVTEASVWADYLAYHGDIADWFLTRCGRDAPNDAARQFDMVYGILLARTLYFWRDHDRLPPVTDIDTQATRYKMYYNTAGGEGSEQEFIENYQRLVSPYYPVPRRA